MEVNTSITFQFTSQRHRSVTLHLCSNQTVIVEGGMEVNTSITFQFTSKRHRSVTLHLCSNQTVIVEGGMEVSTSITFKFTSQRHGSVTLYLCSNQTVIVEGGMEVNDASITFKFTPKDIELFLRIYAGIRRHLIHILKTKRNLISRFRAKIVQCILNRIVCITFIV